MASKLRMRYLSAFGSTLLLGCFVCAAGAQDDKPIEQPDSPVAQIPKMTRAAAIAHAWDALETALKSDKTQDRISAVTALGTISRSKRAAEDVEMALSDHERDVRLAAVVAAGTLDTPLLLPALRKALDDSAPEVSFAASEVLWKMGDHSGEDILVEVITGERKSGPGFFRSGLHTANKDLHNPSTLAIIGAEQGAYALMGPFGIGLDAARLMVKSGNSANTARVTAVILLSRDKSASTNRELIAAMKDKDYFVRAAAARGVADFHNAETLDALLAAFDDPKPLVRDMAAAGYIRATEAKLRTKAPIHPLAGVARSGSAAERPGSNEVALPHPQR